MKANQQAIWDLTKELSDVLAADYMKRTGCSGPDAQHYATGYTWSMLAGFVEFGASKRKAVAEIQRLIAVKRDAIIL